MRVLIADDSRTERLILSTRLKKWGYDLLLAANGEEALKYMLAPDPPRLAILDWVMPGMTGPKDVLWFLPLALVVVISPLHKVVIPEPWKSRYTFGNWFRASMLYVFTWLALSFLLVNPPLGDVAAPDVAGSYTVIILDGEDVLLDSDNLSSSKGAFILDLNGSDGEAYMVFAINDNTDPGMANLSMTLLSSEFGSSLFESFECLLCAQTAPSHSSKKHQRTRTSNYCHYLQIFAVFLTSIVRRRFSSTSIRPFL